MTAPLVTTWHLEMPDRARLRPARPPSTALPMTVTRAEIPCPELNRFLYTAVGGGWHWTDRLPWTREQWLGYLDRPALETWIGYVAGTPVGYVELEAQAAGDVEIAYFGLLPQFIGKGLGGHLLTAGIERAWVHPGHPHGVRRVWVHTCSLDGPHALRNYTARGFTLFKTETSAITAPVSPAT